MIVETVKRNIERSDAFQERTMGLAKGSEAFVFNVLRKDLYSDPIGSLIREYTVNAQDEHRKHGQTKQPIFIKVPSAFEPELHIRDFAGGLTEEQVFEFFGNYGASDKRDSNLAVGFFGLGCKSAFAYTDSYIVKSFKDGVAFTFNIYIDETEIGRVAKLAEEKTSEPNGVLIIVPVKIKDVSDFQSKVIKTVSYFKVKPTIEGLSYEPTFETKRAVIAGKDWKFYGKDSPVVIMGEIAYPFSVNSFPIDLESWEKELLRSDLEIVASIGEVQVTASREALQMSPKTITAIRARLATIKTEMLSETEKAFKDAKNIFEAKSLYHSVILSGSGYGNIIRQSGAEIEWNGVKLADNVIRFGDNSPHYLTTYTKKWNGRIQHGTATSLVCSKDLNLYFDDTNKVKANYKRRAITLLNDEKVKSVTILHTLNVSDLEKQIGLRVSELPSYSKVEPTMPQTIGRISNGADKSKRAKHTAKVFALKTNLAKNWSRGIASEMWEIKEVDTRNSVYIPIDRFHPNLSRIGSLSEFATLLTALEAIGVDILSVSFVGVKNGQDTNGMIRFDAWLKDTLNASASLKYELALGNAYADYSLLDVTYLKGETLSECIAKDYAVLYNQAKDFAKNARRKNLKYAFNIAGVSVETNKVLLKLHEQFNERYPIIKIVEQYRRGDKQVIDYINERENLLSENETAGNESSLSGQITNAMSAVM